MKRLVISSAVAALIAGGAGVSFAGGGGFPYPNGNNDYGLCTAYQAHSNNPNGQPAPFTAMQEAYDQANGDGAWDQFCADTLAGDGSPGNSEHGHGH